MKTEKLESRVSIELSPFNAVAMLIVLQELVEDSLKKNKNLTAMKEAVDELEFQITKNFTDEHWDSVKLTAKINELTGKTPLRK